MQKDRSLKLLDDLDLVMAQIIRESRIVRRDARKARKLMASGRTRKALKRISRIRNADMDELMSYMKYIINQMLRLMKFLSVLVMMNNGGEVHIAVDTC